MIDPKQALEEHSLSTLPRILFFNVNGSGMGHMNRCLAYAKKLRTQAECTFFSLASAIEVIETMGFEADYFVSPYWSANTTFAWNSELAIRFGMMLEHVKPDVVVFDGTWPFQGFLSACQAYCQAHRRPLKKVWSNRGFLKPSIADVPVSEAMFDLVIVPGEVGSAYREENVEAGRRKMFVPPVALLDDAEIAERSEARRMLDLPEDGRFVLCSLGPGNLKDVSGLGNSLIRAFENRGYQVVWACPPISVKDLELPAGVRALSVYPLARYMKAFDVFVGAAGYNTCCEVVQAGIAALLVPNTELADDQAGRAHLVSGYAPVVVSACDSPAALDSAVAKVLELSNRNGGNSVSNSAMMNGAQLAADAILSLAGRAD